MNKVSVTIITYNEEKNIARAIKSVSFADEIIIVDSASTDQTTKIATQMGCKVFDKEFLGFGQQKNLAASLAENNWILNIDADEEISDELKSSIIRLLNTDDDHNHNYLIKLNRRTMFCGKWIYHGGWYPDKIGRLYHRQYCQWTTPPVHEELLLNNKITHQVLELEGDLNHYSFPSFESQVKTNLKYAKFGAIQLVDSKMSRPSLAKVLIKPIGKFVECYFFKLGFLDGLAGLFIALNAAYSLFMKYSFAYWDFDEKSHSFR